jgi:hypothetical protein
VAVDNKEVVEDLPLAPWLWALLKCDVVGKIKHRDEFGMHLVEEPASQSVSGNNAATGGNNAATGGEQRCHWRLLSQP